MFDLEPIFLIDKCYSLFGTCAIVDTTFGEQIIGRIVSHLITALLINRKVPKSGKWFR